MLHLVIYRNFNFNFCPHIKDTQHMKLLKYNFIYKINDLEQERITNLIYLFI